MKDKLICDKCAPNSKYATKSLDAQIESYEKGYCFICNKNELLTYKITGNKDKEQTSQAEEIIKIVKENAELFHDQYSEPYSAIKVNAHVEIHSIKSKYFCLSR